MKLSDELEFFSEIHIDDNKIEDEQEKEVYRLYNNAISYIKYNSEDIAVICLKKAVAYNSEFLEAYNLMTVIYISKKQYSEAIECINKVLEVDNSNAKAIKYLEQINVENPGTLQQVSDGLKDVGRKSGNIKNKKPIINSSKNNYRPKTINIKVISYPIFMLGIILIVIGVVASKINGLSVNNHDDSNVKTKYVLNREKDKANKAKKHHGKYDVKNINESNSKNKNANKSETKDQQSSKKLTTQQIINDAAQRIANSDYNGSADELLKIEKSKLSYEQSKQYSQLTEKIYDETAEDNYNTGANYYKSNNYKQAVVYLERYALNGKTDDYRRYALYYLVRSYLILGNKQKAIEVYNKLADEYPQADLTELAGKWINNNW